MALTPGSQRRHDDIGTVSLQARTAPDTKLAYKAMADASGLSLGLFLDELVKLIPVDALGRPLGMPATVTTHEELFRMTG